MLLHPLLLPTYLVALLCYAFPGGLELPTGLAFRGELVLRVWGLTFALPGLLVGLLQLRGHITSVELYERRQRPLPLLIAALAFGAATLHLSTLPHAGALAHVLLVMTLSALLTLIITLAWKISAHGMGMGGAIGLFAVLGLSQRLPPAQAALWLLGTLLLSGAVAWARLRLKAHSPAQVLAGLALGTGVVGLLTLYEWPTVAYTP